MGSVPHFSQEWLEQYNANLRKSPKVVIEPRLVEQTAVDVQSIGKPPKSAPVRNPAKTDGKLSDYSADATAVPSRGWSGKQTATEKRYNRDVLNGMGRFEAVCLYLPGGGRYTPDFMTVDDGTVTFHEVKGSYRLGSQGRAHTAFQEAASAFPIWRFVWAVERKGGGFDRKVFDPVSVI